MKPGWIFITTDMKGLSLSAAVVDTNTAAYVGAGGKDLGKRSLVLGAKFAF